jgi:hypothetical protein
MPDTRTWRLDLHDLADGDLTDGHHGHLPVGPSAYVAAYVADEPIVTQTAPIEDVDSALSLNLVPAATCSPQPVGATPPRADEPRAAGADAHKRLQV